MKKFNKLRNAVILMAVLSLVAIGVTFAVSMTKNNASNNDKLIIKSNVSVLTADTPKEKQPVSVLEDKLIFNMNPRYPDGEILVSGIMDTAPAGFIRKVVGTEKKGNQYVVKTEYGVLTDVFEEAHIDKSFLLTEDDAGMIEVSLQEQNSEKSSNAYAFGGYKLNQAKENETMASLELMGNKSSDSFKEKFDYNVSAGIKAKGEVGFNVWLEIKIDIKHGNINLAMIAHDKVKGNLSISADLDAEVNFKEELFKKKLPNIQFFAGVVPIVITNKLQSNIEGSAYCNGSVETSVGLESENASGFVYSSKSDKVKEVRKRKYFDEGLRWKTEAIFSGESSAVVYLHLISKLYGSTGTDVAVGIEGKVEGDVGANIDEETKKLNYVGSMDSSISPRLRGSIVVTTPIVDRKLKEMPLFNVKLKPLWEKHWDSGKGWKGELQNLEPEKKYFTKWGEVNAITYPWFSFSYPSNWKIKSEEVAEFREKVVLANDRGAKIEYCYMGNVPRGSFGKGAHGGSTVVMERIDVLKVIDASFIPGFVQATDHSSLGEFMVAKLKTTGHLNMQYDSEFTSSDGPISYAVLPESRISIGDSVRNPLVAEYSFWYSGYVSLIAYAPEDGFTKQEEKEVIAILKSFRAEY